LYRILAIGAADATADKQHFSENATAEDASFE
jgi:hypothetical protein